MIDLKWTELSPGLSLLFNSAFILFVFLFLRKYAIQPDYNKSKANLLLVMYSLLMIVLVSASSASDWYNYQELVFHYDFSPNASNHGEPIYGVIIKFVNQNYLLFRLIVWGGAFALTCLSFKRFNINLNVAVFFLMAVYLLKFNYARATMAMACYYYGLSYLLKPLHNKVLLSFVLAALFFGGAFSFHHSILPVLLLSLAAFFPLDKPVWVLLLLIFIPTAATIMYNDFEIISSFGDEYLESRLNSYLEKEAEKANTLGIIANIISYGTFVLPLLITTIVVSRNRRHIQLPIIQLYRVMIAICVFSVSFLFMGLMSTVFTYRYLFMTFIAITIISVYLYQNNLMRRPFYLAIILWGVLANFQAMIVPLIKML